MASRTKRQVRETELKLNQVYCMDVLHGLRRMPDESVDCVMTSPPYWAMRDYGLPPVARPDGTRCALGLEADPKLYLEHLCMIFDEVRRVLKPTGTLWVNIGDGYHNGNRWGTSKGSPQSICSGNNRNLYRGPRRGNAVPKKSLILIPARFSIKMVERGWILRNVIVWHKPNHMPQSVKDRLTSSWEHVLLFVKEPRYYFDLDAIRIPHQTPASQRKKYNAFPNMRSAVNPSGQRLPPNPGERGSFHPLGKNPGDCWQINTRSFPGAHFAVFPEQLCEIPIKAGCPARVCKRCGIPAVKYLNRNVLKKHDQGKSTRNGSSFGCKCKRGVVPGLVLDPFVGSGTTVVVAKKLGRRFIGFDANPNYIRMAKKRLSIL